MTQALRYNNGLAIYFVWEEVEWRAEESSDIVKKIIGPDPQLRVNGVFWTGTLSGERSLTLYNCFSNSV